MTDVILTLNAGSSSLKAGLYARENQRAGESIARFHLSAIGPDAALAVTIGDKSEHRTVDAKDNDAAWPVLLEVIASALAGKTLRAVGHRVVHGGADYAAPIIVSEAIRAQLETLTPLAPLHEPYNLAGIDYAGTRWPDALQIACFDTGFHRSQPAKAQRFALPHRYFDQGVLRYGFHGLSYEFIATQMSSVMDGHPAERVIIAHLGSGVSMCALRDGVSVATTMGFTALAGLPMSTRCGDIDPGVLLYLQEVEGMSAADLAHLLHKESGLKGLSGMTGDMRALETSEKPRAKEAVEYFVYRCQREIGSLAAALGGLDAVIFTAGIGENSPSVRAQIANGLEWLGAKLDPERNAEGGPKISQSSSRVTLWSIGTDEEAMLAKHAANCLAGKTST